MLGDQVQVVGHEIKYLRIPKPAGRVAVDLQRSRLEDEHMATVFQGGHVGVEGLPVVAHQGHSAGGGKSARDALAMQDTGGCVPTERFGLLRLGHALEQANAATVGIKAVDVVEDEGLMPMFVGL